MAALRCTPCGWRRVLAAGVLMALALVALDIATDYDEDDDAGLRPRGMIFDELDDGGPDDLWTLETKMSRGCAPGTRSNGCERVDAVVVADGELGERVHAVCAASAMTALSSLLTLAVWPADRHMPHVRFSHLFSLTPPAPASSSADSPATPAPNATAGGGGGGGRGSGESAFVGGPERRVWVRESALPAAAWRSGLNLARRTVHLLAATPLPFHTPLLAPHTPLLAPHPPLLAPQSLTPPPCVRACLPSHRPALSTSSQTPTPHSPPFPMAAGGGTRVSAGLNGGRAGRGGGGQQRGRRGGQHGGAPLPLAGRRQLARPREPRSLLPTSLPTPLPCTPASHAHLHPPLPLITHCPPAVCPPASLPDACAFERAMGACMAALHPSPPVQQLLQKENATRLHASYGVFVDTLAAAGCSGCASSKGSTAVECVMRRVTMSFLKDPSKGFTLAASNPHHTAAVADFFHPHRAPTLLHATLLRAATCPFGEHVTAAPGPRNLLPGTSAAALQALQAGAVAGGGGGAGDEGGSGGGEEVAVLLPFNNRITPEQLLLCLHARVAELYALSRTRGLIAVNSSSAEARFIAAHGSAASELFRVQRAVCDSPPLRPITHLKFAKYTIVEERLGVMYCGVPSVASTAWLTWLRARLGLPAPREGRVAVDDRDGGLHELALHFTEPQAVRIITRPDLLRFTFVRNPFSRLASTFRSTVLASHHSHAPTSRDHWSNALFRAVRPIVEAVVREGEGQLSFPSFVRLVGRLMDHSRPLMDSRIAPQVDVCALSAIKYDVVGRVESLMDDARAVVDRVGGGGQGAHMEIFEEDGTGKGADADASLARLYDKDTYEAVKSIYAMDFYVALNNITQPAPHVLHDLLESEL
ncbi:unnamed protein product [Closterium sp. Naga37s-1]|nr:unnamed protein product [Closterium sp. Naga37s-1]